MGVQQFHGGVRPLGVYEPRGQGWSVSTTVRTAPQPYTRPLLRPAATAVSSPARRPIPAAGSEFDQRHLRWILTTLLEVHEGRRPVQQVRALLSNSLYRRLTANARASTPRHTLKTVHACQPCQGAVEACGTVHADGRALALVARFETSGEGLRCTSFTLVAPQRRR